MSWSEPPAASRLPSGENATEPATPTNVRSSFPLPTSQILASALPEAIQLLSGENATDPADFVPNLRTICPVLVSQSATVSLAPETIHFPSGENATDYTSKP